jgi:hypothetical protein
MPLARNPTIITKNITMKIVRVQYTTTYAFAPINQQNIRGIVKELEALRHPGIQYSAYLLPDGKTFMHFDQFDNEASHALLQELESFKKFAAELWASGLEAEPVLELPSLVASTQKLFL